jgi:hypothetical protein
VIARRWALLVAAIFVAGTAALRAQTSLASPPLLVGMLKAHASRL